jgi:hypothetical protein
MRGELWGIALIVAVLTVPLAYPLSVHPATTVLPIGADANLFLWTLQWDTHALTHRPFSIFDANIYYPFPHTLAYSENLIGSSLIAAPLIWTTHNSVLALNAVALLSCVLSGVGAYLLARQLGVGSAGAAIAAIIFAFAPPRFLRIGQIHLTTVQWVPFCLTFVHRYLDSGRARDLHWACGFFALQALTSGHGAVFAALAAGALIVWRTVLGAPVRPVKWLRDLGLPGLAATALVVLISLPYLSVQREMGLRRSLEEATFFSPSASSFLASPSHLHRWVLSRFAGVEIPRDARAFLFPGYLAVLLAIVGAWPGGATRGTQVPATERDRWRLAATVNEIAVVVSIVWAAVVTFMGPLRIRYGATVIVSARSPMRAWLVCAMLVAVRVALSGRARFELGRRARAQAERVREWSERLRGNDVAFYGVLAVVTLWLSLGTPFGLYRLVYGWPGFSFIRVPSRFTILTLLAVAILAAAGFERLTAQFSARPSTGSGRASFWIAAAILVAEYFAAPLAVTPLQVEIPAVDRWLATRPAPFVVAEVPLASPNDVVASARRQSLYMLHSAAHWQKTIHGYSGMQPALHDQLYSEMLRFPDESVLARLASLGVTYVVVHGELYSDEQWRAIAGRLDRSGDWLALQHADGNARVYSLRDARIFAR